MLNDALDLQIAAKGRETLLALPQIRSESQGCYFSLRCTYGLYSID